MIALSECPLSTRPSVPSLHCEVRCWLLNCWCGQGGSGGESRRGKSLEAGLEAVWDGRENPGHQLELALTKACFCDCLQKDYHFEYTECDSTGSRWRSRHSEFCSGLLWPAWPSERQRMQYVVIFDHLFSRLNHKLIISVLDAVKTNTRDQAMMYI